MTQHKIEPRQSSYILNGTDRYGVEFTGPTLDGPRVFFWAPESPELFAVWKHGRWIQLSPSKLSAKRRAVLDAVFKAPVRRVNP